MIFFDSKRVEELARLLSQSGNDFYEFFIERDPQYTAVREILSKMGFSEGAFYIVGVAIVSYMLATRGEEHWMTAASYASGDPDQSLLSFVESSASLRKFRTARIKRIQKYIQNKEEIIEAFKGEEIDLGEFSYKLAEILDANINDKTILFASKMLLYTCRAANIGFKNFEKLLIPVDYRVSLVTLTSGIAKGWRCNENLRSLAGDLRSRYKKEVQEAWRRVGEASGIPPILLDAPIWLVGGCIDKAEFNPQEILRCVRENLAPSPNLLEVLKEFWCELDKCRNNTRQSLLFFE